MAGRTPESTSCCHFKSNVIQPEEGGGSHLFYVFILKLFLNLSFINLDGFLH